MLVPHIPWLGVLMPVFVVKGVAGGIVLTGANTLLLWTHGGKAGPFLNALHFFWGLGAFLSPFLLGLLITAGGVYSEAYLILAIFDFSVGAAVLVYLRPPLAVRGEHADVATSRAAGRLLIPIVLAAMLFLFFYVSAELTFGGWIYTYAVTLGLADAAAAAYLTSLFWFAVHSRSIGFDPRGDSPLACPDTGGGNRGMHLLHGFARRLPGLDGGLVGGCRRRRLLDGPDVAGWLHAGRAIDPAHGSRQFSDPAR